MSGTSTAAHALVMKNVEVIQAGELQRAEMWRKSATKAGESFLWTSMKSLPAFPKELPRTGGTPLFIKHRLFSSEERLHSNDLGGASFTDLDGFNPFA